MSVKFIGFVDFHRRSEIWDSEVPGLDLDYIAETTRAQEEGGFDRVLIPFTSESPDSIVVAAHVAAITSRLGLMIAHRPGFTQPTITARQLATVDKLSGGRAAVHIITGGSDADLRRDGDHLTKAERYARTDEYLTIMRRQWTEQKRFDFNGKYYQVEGASSDIKPTGALPVFFGGSSDEAIDVAGRQADIYALWGETLDQVRDTIARVRKAADRYGRRISFSLSLRPVLGDTEEAAWKRADDIVERIKEIRRGRGQAEFVGSKPENTGSQRLIEAAQQGYRLDKCLWTGVAALGGAPGNATGLVGTVEQVADALMDYRDLGVDHFLIRGFDPLSDAIAYGRDLLPEARRQAERRRAVEA